jgi:preprotein translocase subunit YajC
MITLATIIILIGTVIFFEYKQKNQKQTQKKTFSEIQHNAEILLEQCQKNGGFQKLIKNIPRKVS